MQKKKILSLAIATATVVTGLVGVTTAYNSLEVLDNGDLKVCGTEYISDSNGAEGCITIQGKNVGSTTTGAGPSAPDTSYGNYYQWGDNTPRTEANWLTNPLWDNNAWGGESDNEDNGYGYPVLTPEERQGPCDIGYHVPSIGEWRALMDMWADSSVNGYIGSNISQFYTDFQIPFAGYRDYENGGSPDRQGTHVHLWSSSVDWYPRGLIIIDGYKIAEDSDGDRRYGFPVRCFKDPVKLISTITENTTTTIGGNAPVTGLPTTMTVTQNTISTAEGKEVLGEVNVDFGSNQTAIFSHPVEVNIPVSDYEQVIVKVKHGGESEYGFAGLTRNSNASCSNGEVVATSDRYNGETINVVDGYATIYSCAASSFIALGAENGGDSLITVNIAEFNGGQNTCTGSNFIFDNIIAGTDTESYTLTGTFECAFGNGSSHSSVTLQLSGNLVASGDKIISGSNVEMMNSEWTVAPTGLKFANTLINTYRALTATQTIFQKSANLIGAATGEVTIRLTVPGGTPDGTYNGVLVLTY